MLNGDGREGVRNLSAVALHNHKMVGSLGPSDIHLFGFCTKQLAGKLFVRHGCELLHLDHYNWHCFVLGRNISLGGKVG